MQDISTFYEIILYYYNIYIDMTHRHITSDLSLLNTGQRVQLPQKEAGTGQTGC